MSEWEVLRHGVAIAGQVTDGQTAKAIGGARIEITAAPVEFTDWLAIRAEQYGDRWLNMVERPDRALAAADGHFHFLDLPDGDYTLAASLPGSGTRYGTSEAEATVSRDGGGSINWDTADLALPPTTVVGRVRDRDTGDPVVMAEVRVGGSGVRTFSDVDGRYSLTALETGERIVLVSARGYRPASRTVMLTEAGTKETVPFALRE